MNEILTVKYRLKNENEDFKKEFIAMKVSLDVIFQLVKGNKNITNFLFLSVANLINNRTFKKN